MLCGVYVCVRKVCVVWCVCMCVEGVCMCVEGVCCVVCVYVCGGCVLFGCVYVWVFVCGDKWPIPPVICHNMGIFLKCVVGMI